MVDVLTKEQRSYCMSRIRGKHTKPETALRKFLRCGGIQFHVYAKLPGKPDIVFSREKLAVFIDGCFWHKCQKCFVKPATRTRFWMRKIEGNVKRDREVNLILAKQGWKVLRFWEHDIRKNLARVGLRVQHALK